MSCGKSTNGEVTHTTTLRQWMEEGETLGRIIAQQNPGDGEAEHRQIILRKTTIAYGMAALLRRAARSRRDSDFPLPPLGVRSSIDNFAVRAKSPGRRPRPTWKDIEGVDMLSPRLSVNIIEPSFLRDVNDGIQDDEMGQYLEAEFPFLPETDEGAVFVSQVEEDDRCHSFGVLLYELFFSRPQTYAGERADDSAGPRFDTNNVNVSLERARKRSRTIDSGLVDYEKNRSTARARRERAYPALRRGESADLSGGEFPSSLSLVIHNLLDCGEDDRPDNSYESLEEVIGDLHLLLLDPRRFLFNQAPIRGADGRMQLSFRQHQLYGRVHEVSLITEAFCRVSSGRSESLFIGGFSGSGKSRLVNGLMARVDVAGGYVLTHKFDQMSKGRPVLEVVAIFNDLCLLIREKSHQRALLVLARDLVEVFGSDWTILARLIPNIKTIVPSFEQSADDDGGGMESQMNVRSISFTLQRFLRVVSSVTHPVVLFLDDLQWCDNSALSVVESLLCDAVGPSCLFFVGTYRSNEVGDGHEIFRLVQRLKIFGVPTTMISLEGLNPRDLNTMVSDALCIFPRLTEPLSDIIYQKTKGNPFFAISFVRSLVDGGLLEYSTTTRRWVWDEDKVSSMDITGNVLHLLSSKMSGLSSEIQSAFKVAACFGIKIKVSVMETLSTHPAHSDVRDNLDQVIKEGFMCKVGNSEFKFVHDKVREAAYSLIPEQDRDQYHYSLGMALFSITNGKVADDMLFSIADQIKHGIGNLAAGENSELRLDMAKLYGFAGVRAAASSDHIASRSYLEHALSRLSPDPWASHYDLCLQFSLRLAKSCYSCGDAERAQSILQVITGHCRSIEDKVPAHALLATILSDRNRFPEVYTLCSEVLSQLGEDVPESLSPLRIPIMIVRTLSMVKDISETYLLGMNEMDDRLSYCIRFYNIITNISNLSKPQMIPFFACRMVQLTMKNGLCKYSILGFIQFAAMLCNNKYTRMVGGIRIASRIGKAAMACSTNRYQMLEGLPNLNLIYYTTIGFRIEPLQTCAVKFRQGFDTSMSLGETGVALFNSIQYTRTALIAGERLPSLLDKVDNYLELTKTYQNDVAQMALCLFRGTITTLIDGSTSLTVDVPTDAGDVQVLTGLYFHRALQSYWQGHNERCQHFIQKFSTLVTVDTIRENFMIFIAGMNSCQLLRVANRSIRSQTASLKSLSNAIDILKVAASHSSWNFQNKAQLLEAEQLSIKNKVTEAHASFAAAIGSARASGFIHEQGLACELAGYHCKRVNDFGNAWVLFNRAKQCYAEWGSQMKVDSISPQLESLSDYMPGGASSSAVAGSDLYSDCVYPMCHVRDGEGLRGEKNGSEGESRVIRDDGGDGSNSKRIPNHLGYSLLTL